MSIEELRAFFGWCSIINIGILLVWFVEFVLMRDWIYKIHTKWYKLSDERFDAIHYGAIAVYKLAVIVFNVIPYIALRIIA